MRALSQRRAPVRRMAMEIYLEGTDGVGKSSIVAALRAEGLACHDRHPDVISRYMLFDVPMDRRADHYERLLTDHPEVVVIFLFNYDGAELMRRIMARPKPMGEFDRFAPQYNRLYSDTYDYMASHDMLHGRLLALDLTGLDLRQGVDAVRTLVQTL